MEISGLEDEFRLSGSLPRLLYVKAPAPDREPGLTALIGELQSEGTESYRSFTTPHELEQLVQDDLALLLSERFASTQAQPIEPASQVARSLPVTSTSLIGRDDDIAAVVRLLETPDTRLVSLTGPGGIGKTRLAIAVGEHLEAREPNGVAFVALASIDRADLVLPHIAAEVGATAEGARPVLDVLAEHFTAHRALLVLDNLEQVVDVAPQLDQLLSRCADLKMVTTTRTVLRLRAEREHPVGPLLVPSRLEQPLIDDVSELPAVRLFVDRAQAVRYDFALEDGNARDVAEICRRLDGLPLAIELAAARTRLLEPNALLTRLDESLDALGTGPVDLPERQRTLRATVEWSVGLLDDPEREMLAAMSVFVGGWTIEAATAVSALDEEQVLDLLDTLAGHSLVKVDATDQGPRFRMLVSVRELAGEQLMAGPERADIERRHAAYFGAMVENANWPAERQAEWAEQLRIEEGNLAAAVRWFLDNDITPLPHIFRILWLFWQMRDRMSEGRARIDDLQSHAATLGRSGPARAVPDLHHHRGRSG